MEDLIQQNGQLRGNVIELQVKLIGKNMNLVQFRDEITTLRVKLEERDALIASLMMAQNNHHLLLEQLFFPFQSQQRHQSPQQSPQQYQHQHHQQTPQQVSRYVPQHTLQQPNKQKATPKKEPLFDPIPMLYANSLPILLEKNLVQLRAPPKIPAKLPRWYRTDQSCSFYQGAPGHDTEQCFALKAEVQKLIETNEFSSKDLNPNLQKHKISPDDKDTERRKAPMSFLKDTKEVVQSRLSTGWGHVVAFPENKCLEGLGSSSSARVVKPRNVIKSVRDTFYDDDFVQSTSPENDVVHEDDFEECSSSFVVHGMV